MIYRCQNKQTQNITPRSPLPPAGLRSSALRSACGARRPAGSVSAEKTHGHINVIQKEEEEEKSNNH